MFEEQERRFGINGQPRMRYVRGGRGGKNQGHSDDEYGGRGVRGHFQMHYNRYPYRRNNRQSKWNPVTRLGRLVKSRQITSLDQIFANSWPIKEVEIIDYLTLNTTYYYEESTFKVEIMNVSVVTKQTTAGLKTKMKCWVLVGDGRGNIGLAVKTHKDLKFAIKAATNKAKLSIAPVRKGYWGNRIDKPHTVPMKVSGKVGSVRVRLIPAPRGTGIVGPNTIKKLLEFSGISDCYIQSKGSTKTTGNFLFATFHALTNSMTYLTPEFWGRDYVESEDSGSNYSDDF
jgi:ribosomal protein uS5